MKKYSSNNCHVESAVKVVYQSYQLKPYVPAHKREYNCLHKSGFDWEEWHPIELQRFQGLLQDSKKTKKMSVEYYFIYTVQSTLLLITSEKNSANLIKLVFPRYIYQMFFSGIDRMLETTWKWRQEFQIQLWDVWSGLDSDFFLNLLLSDLNPYSNLGLQLHPVTYTANPEKTRVICRVTTSWILQSKVESYQVIISTCIKPK